MPVLSGLLASGGRACPERSERNSRAPGRRRLPLAICPLIFFFSLTADMPNPGMSAPPSRPLQDARPVPVQHPKPPVAEPTAPAPGSAEPASSGAENDETPLPGDWAPELL